MKKLTALFLSTLFILIAITLPVSATDDIKVVLDGKELVFEQPPVIVNDRTMVPMRAIFEALGAEVDWNTETKTASGYKCGIYIEFPIDEAFMIKNTIDIALDAPATLINGYTMLPVRAVAESFGVEVNWDAASKTVKLTDRNCFDSYITASDHFFEGESIEGYPNGYGMVTDPNNEDKIVKIGLFKDAYLIKGSIFFESGDWCNGEFEDGVLNGFGEYHWANGNYYIGDWVDNLKHGNGAMYFANGDYYIGEFQYDAVNITGDIYKGNRVNGIPDGYGEYFWPSGEMHKGNFVDGKYEGYGEHYYKSGDIYKGYYINDMCEGIGEYHWADGIYAKGKFTLGEMDGTFKFYNANGLYLYDKEYHSEAANIAYTREYNELTEQYLADKQELREWYFEQLEELQDLISCDPFTTDWGKAIMKQYSLDQYNLNPSYGISGNSGNIDSYAAANAARQQLALTSSTTSSKCRKTTS